MINSVVLTGRIAQEFELQTTADGVKLVSFNIAIDGIKEDEDSTFLSCIVFEKQAETMCQYLSKGSLIGIEGRIKTRKYETMKGEKRISTEIIVRKLTFLETKAQNIARETPIEAVKQPMSGFSEADVEGYFK